MNKEAAKKTALQLFQKGVRSMSDNSDFMKNGISQDDAVIVRECLADIEKGNAVKAKYGFGNESV